MLSKKTEIKTKKCNVKYNANIVLFAYLKVSISVSYQASRPEDYVLMIQYPIIILPFITLLFPNNISERQCGPCIHLMPHVMCVSVLREHGIKVYRLASFSIVP